MTMTGGCLCGKVRYEVSGEPIFTGKCYCDDCHKESGTGHVTVLTVPGDAVHLTGETKTYTQPGDSGADVVRTFCPNCGTTLYGEPAMMKGVKMVRTGTLDDSSGIAANMAIYGAKASHWDLPPAGIELHAGMPMPS
jgi:hypothetical protein